MKKFACMAILASSLILSNPVAAETLNNQTVVSLLNAGLGDEAVIAKIETSDGEYKTDVSDLLSLRSQGVSSAVIAAMVSRKSEVKNTVTLSSDSPDPSVPHYTGTYIMQPSENKMARIDPIGSTQVKTGGMLGYALTGGIASVSVKAVFPGEKARITANESRPTAYFYFDSSNPSIPTNGISVFSNGIGMTIQSPNEISLVRLKKKKGRREARVGSANIGGMKGGIMDKDQVAFDYEQVRVGVYKATPKEDLAPGEYGYIYTVAGGSSGGVSSARVFEFSVK